MLTPRLNTICNHINGKIIADIGTDHAYIPIAMIKQNKIISAIACDINSGPLEIANDNIKKYRLESQITLRLGEGLSQLKPNEVDEIIIAGMGGQLIKKIISDNIDLAKSTPHLILQPMNAQAELREFLIQNGFTIIKEDLALEGFKIYNILSVCTGYENPRSTFEYHIPPSLHNHPLMPSLLAKKQREFQKIINGLSKSSTPDTNAIAYYQALLNSLLSIEKK